MSDLPRATEKEVGDLVSKFDHIKVNLVEGNDRTKINGEGIWAVPIDEFGAKVAQDNDCFDAKFKVIMCNSPIFWPGEWGNTINAVTKGPTRACAYLEDNAHLAERADNGKR